MIHPRIFGIMSKLITLLFMVVTGGLAADWQPAGPSEWVRVGGDQPNLFRATIGGEGYANYQISAGHWAAIDNRFVVSPDSVYCHTALLRTTVYPDGRSRVYIKDDETVRGVTQKLVGIGWINKQTWAHQWIDNSLSFGTPTVDSNRIKWSNVSPGVDYTVTKVHAGVQHGIHFSPAFLDSAVILFDQRADSAEIGLANLFKFEFENIESGDSAVGDVTAREFARFARHKFGLSRQHLFFSGWDDTSQAGEPLIDQIDIRQYWKRVGADLYCLEWVPMSQLKAVHLEHPTATIWHNVADTLTADTTEFKDNWLCEWNNSYNNGAHNELWIGYHTTNSGYGNGFLWWNMPVDTSYRLVTCSLSVIVTYDGVDDDTLILLPCDTTISSGYGVGNAWRYTGVGNSDPSDSEQSWNKWFDWYGVPFTNDTAWAEPGGDWLGDTIARIPVSGSFGTGKYTVELDSSYMAALLSGRKNSGFFLITKDRSSTTDNRKEIWSTEASSSFNRPSVEVYYLTPDQQYLWASSIYDVDSTSSYGSYEMFGASTWESAITGTNPSSYIQNQYDANLYSNGDSMRIIYDLSDCEMATIDSVILYTKAHRSMFGDSTGNLMRAGLIIGSDTAFGQTWSNTTISIIRDKLSRPGGGAWTDSDLDNARFLFETISNWSVGVESNSLYQMYIIVHGNRDSGLAVVSRRRDLLLKRGR